jgi:hypothetical protein
LIQSQLVILKLGRLKQTADLHSTLALLILRIFGRQLALFSKELGVVSRKFLE